MCVNANHKTGHGIMILDIVQNAERRLENMNQFNPCPFCGSSSLSIRNVYDEDGITILCDKCNGGMWIGISELPDFDEGEADYELSIETKGIEPLIKKWNRRAYMPQEVFEDNCTCTVKPCHHANMVNSGPSKCNKEYREKKIKQDIEVVMKIQLRDPITKTEKED